MRSAIQLSLIACCILFNVAAALARIHVAQVFGGERRFSLARFIERARSTSARQGAAARAAFWDERERAFDSASDIDPDLRRLYVRERRLQRLGWASLAALALSTGLPGGR